MEKRLDFLEKEKISQLLLLEISDCALCHFKELLIIRSPFDNLTMKITLKWISLTLFTSIELSQSYITHSYLHLRSQRHHISPDSSYSNQVLCATASKSNIVVSGAENSPKESENEEFLAWEKEELELWEVEQQLQRNQIIEDSNEDGLPRYMNEMLSEYGNLLMENNVNYTPSSL